MIIKKAMREIPEQIKKTAAGSFSTVHLQIALKIILAANEMTISVDAMNANKLPLNEKDLKKKYNPS